MAKLLLCLEEAFLGCIQIPSQGFNCFFRLLQFILVAVVVVVDIAAGVGVVVDIAAGVGVVVAASGVGIVVAAAGVAAEVVVVVVVEVAAAAGVAVVGRSAVSVEDAVKKDIVETSTR